MPENITKGTDLSWLLNNEEKTLSPDETEADEEGDRIGSSSS
jgi:hypothetical protein